MAKLGRYIILHIHEETLRGPYFVRKQKIIATIE